MQLLDKKEEFDKILTDNKAVIIYFSGENCSVCKVLKPKIENEIKKVFPKIKVFEVKTDENREFTSQLTVFSIPTIIVFFEGKEFKRYGRNISIPIFLEEIKRPYDFMCE